MTETNSSNIAKHDRVKEKENPAAGRKHTSLLCLLGFICCYIDCSAIRCYREIFTLKMKSIKLLFFKVVVI